MKIDLQTLDETARNELLLLAEAALSTDGRFEYLNKRYVAKRLNDNSIEISLFQLEKYRLDNLSPEKKLEFSEKIKVAKESSNPDDKKFIIDGVAVQVIEAPDGKFTIQTIAIN